VQAKTSSIVISSGPQQPGHRGTSRTHHAQLVLQLPEPHTQLLCQNCTSGQISSFTSLHPTSSHIEGASTVTPSVGSSAQGTAALQQLCSNKSKVQKAQVKKVVIASQGPISAPSQASGQVIAAGLESSCVKTAGSAVSPYQLCLLTYSDVLIATNSAGQAAELNSKHSTC
jgi:hypothetical protein